MAAGDDAVWHAVGGVGEPAFSSGWSNYSAPYGGVRFRKVGSLVVMQGLAAGGSQGTIFVLPVGFRPSTGGSGPSIHIFTVAAAGGFGEVRIDTVGASYTQWGITLVIGTATYVSLATVMFIAEN
jgi:hypothetical protein